MSKAKIGDNVLDSKELMNFIERLETLTEEAAEVRDSAKEVKVEAKSKGYDIRTIERILALRRQDERQREVEREMLETYMASLGML